MNSEYTYSQKVRNEVLAFISNRQLIEKDFTGEGKVFSKVNFAIVRSRQFWIAAFPTISNSLLSLLCYPFLLYNVTEYPIYFFIIFSLALYGLYSTLTLLLTFLSFYRTSVMAEIYISQKSK
jgi:hypothetical protein